MKTLLFSTLIAIATYSPLAIWSAQTIDTAGQPTIGNPEALIHVVAFLEPKCPDSKRYNNASFPKLKAEFIDTNKISYTVITTSFLSQSMPAAIALLCIYNQAPNAPHTDLFFKYLDYIYLNQPPEKENWATIETLLKFADNVSPEIDQKQLKNCIEKKSYSSQVEKNTAYGNKLMGHLSTPTIYVNGVKIENSNETIDYENLKKAIQQAQGQSLNLEMGAL